MLFPVAWLDTAIEGGSPDRTNRVEQTAVSSQRPRHALLSVWQLYLHRVEMTRPQKLIGALSQMVHLLAREMIMSNFFLCSSAPSRIMSRRRGYAESQHPFRKF